MKISFALSALSCSFMCICFNANSQSAENRSAEYKLVWADEFDKDGPPDSSNWKFEKGFVRNEELQWYQQENAWCENGFLIIEARKESKPNPKYETGGKNWRTNRK